MPHALSYDTLIQCLEACGFHVHTFTIIIALFPGNYHIVPSFELCQLLNYIRAKLLCLYGNVLPPAVQCAVNSMA